MNAAPLVLLISAALAAQATAAAPPLAGSAPQIGTAPTSTTVPAYFPAQAFWRTFLRLLRRRGGFITPTDLERAYGVRFTLEPGGGKYKSYDGVWPGQPQVKFQVTIGPPYHAPRKRIVSQVIISLPRDDTAFLGPCLQYDEARKDLARGGWGLGFPLPGPYGSGPGEIFGREHYFLIIGRLNRIYKPPTYCVDIINVNGL